MPHVLAPTPAARWRPQSLEDFEQEHVRQGYKVRPVMAELEMLQLIHSAISWQLSCKTKWSSIRTAFEFEKQNGPPKSLKETHGAHAMSLADACDDITSKWANFARQHQVVP